MVAHPQTEAGGAKPGGSGRGRHSCPAPGRSPGWSTSSGPAFEPEAPAAALVTFEPKGPAAARAVGGQAPDVDALGRPGSAGGAFREQPLAVVRPDVRGTVFRTVTSADGSRRATSTHAASPRGRAAHRQYDARPPSAPARGRFRGRCRCSPRSRRHGRSRPRWRVDARREGPHGDGTVLRSPVSAVTTSATMGSRRGAPPDRAARLGRRLRRTHAARSRGRGRENSRTTTKARRAHRTCGPTSSPCAPERRRAARRIRRPRRPDPHRRRRGGVGGLRLSASRDERTEAVARIVRCRHGASVRRRDPAVPPHRAHPADVPAGGGLRRPARAGFGRRRRPATAGRTAQRESPLQGRNRRCDPCVRRVRRSGVRLPAGAWTSAAPRIVIEGSCADRKSVV